MKAISRMRILGDRHIARHDILRATVLHNEVEVAPLNRTHYYSVKGARDESKTRGVRA